MSESLIWSFKIIWISKWKINRTHLHYHTKFVKYVWMKRIWISWIGGLVIFCRGHKIFNKTFYSGGTLFSPTTPNLLSPTNVERGLALKPAANSSFYPRAHCRHRAEDWGVEATTTVAMVTEHSLQLPHSSLAYAHQRSSFILLQT